MTFSKRRTTMNRNKLIGKIKEQGKTIQQMAAEVGISLTAMSRKINGKTQFTREEIEKIADLLELTNEELLAIFFSDVKVS